MTFSATRIDTWIQCNRKAAWEYICGYKEPKGRAQELGDQVHKYLEYLKQNPGSVPDRTHEVGAIAAEALPHVEHLSLQDGAEIEGEFTFEGRHKWIGFKDIKDPGVEIFDYKTSSDPGKWAKTAEALLLDPQAALYAEHEFRQYPGGGEMPLTWLYLATRKPYRAHPVRVTFTREHAAACFAALESYADEMQAAAYAAPGDIVERHKYVLNVIKGNEDFCDAYGGCPHQSRCNIPMFREKKKDVKPMNLLERLNAMAALNGGPANTPTPANPPPGPFAGIEPPANPTPGGNPMLPARMQAALAGDAPAPLAGHEPAAVNPPKRGPGRPRKAPADTMPAPPPPMVAAAAAVLPAPEPAAVTEAPIGAPAERTFEKRALLPDGAPAPAAGPDGTHRLATLFVACVPMADGHAPPTSFDTVVARAKEMIGAPAYFSNYGYKTNGLLLEAVQRIVQADKPVSLLVFDPRTPEATLCLSYLRSIAAVSVESVRQ